MSTSTPVPNHHADYPGFSGPGGLLAALSMLVGRGPVARMAADLVGVTPGDRVVDIGCGPGAAAREATRRGAQVTGVDPASIMVRVARWSTPPGTSVAWAEGVAEALPLPDGSATVVWSLAAVHHWADIDQGLAEAYRVLSSGGRLLAVERRVRPGASGHASHGWTEAQARHKRSPTAVSPPGSEACACCRRPAVASPCSPCAPRSRDREPPPNRYVGAVRPAVARHRRGLSPRSRWSASPGRWWCSWPRRPARSPVPSTAMAAPMASSESNLKCTAAT